ncbi:MAG TPA: response regulator, partial [Caulobacterales bacterium]|nr:response regulator [Caulobacterales bacterium]
RSARAVEDARVLDRASASANVVAGKRVLVVEDEIVIALDIVDKLDERGCKAVGPAATFDEAQRLIDQGEFDCALLDANLAGQPVDQLAAALTQSNTPFAFVTGYGREALPLAFRDAPMIAKPFSPQQLTDLIELIFTRNEDTVALRQAKR